MIVPSVPNFRSRCLFALTFCLTFLVGGGIFVQASGFVPSPLTRGLKPLVDLQDEWRTTQGQNVRIPFVKSDVNEMQLSHWLTLPKDRVPGKQLYLYLEGLSWTAEIYLNDKLLKVSQDPFAEHLLPLDEDWLHPEGDQIRIVLSSEGKDFLLYPEHFLGVHRGVYVLVSDTSQPPVAQPEVITFTSKAMVLAPWSEKNGFLQDKEVLQKYTQGLFTIPRDIPVCIPFRPSNAALEIMAKSGRKILFSVEGADSLAFYNSYPIGQKPEILHPDFWRNSDLRPGEGYGRFQSWDELRLPESGNLNRLALLSLLFLPVFGLLAIRLGIPRVYDTLPEYLSKTKIYLELIGNNKYLKTSQRFLMNLVRVVITAATISLFLYYLNESGSLSRLNVWSESSILFNMLSGSSFSAIEVLGVSLGILLLINMFKYLILNMAGGIFRLNSFSATMQALDVFASFPLNLLPLLPLVFIFFVDSGIGEILLIVWYIFFLAYLVRRIVLIYFGMSRLFSFSASLKFLYICTLEILPWVLLL